MADIHGIEVSGQIFGLEDETARTDSQTATSTANTAKEAAEEAAASISQFDSRITANEEAIAKNKSAIGTLANLATTVKTNLVAAINELVTKSSQNYSGFLRDGGDQLQRYGFAYESPTTISMAEITSLARKLGYTPKAGDFITLRAYNYPDMGASCIGVGGFRTATSFQEFAPTSSRDVGFFFNTNSISLRTQIEDSQYNWLVEVCFAKGS